MCLRGFCLERFVFEKLHKDQKFNNLKAHPAPSSFVGHRPQSNFEHSLWGKPLGDRHLQVLLKC